MAYVAFVSMFASEQLLLLSIRGHDRETRNAEELLRKKPISKYDRKAEICFRLTTVVEVSDVG